ncbi:RNA polymerase sigma factor [Piscinibacter sp. Jin2]|uniref:RNA polymerase sigma factor n=1 Tax=Aquariibacter lacus TaxID=2801332 RepID=A0A9X0XB64_9BURK|nr:RNA polymerase sigma factor [Piscinibacter lacus]MBL0718887.1 RNA polymerase sigma factor [Piscinibacter lacus]
MNTLVLPTGLEGVAGAALRVALPVSEPERIDLLIRRIQDRDRQALRELYLGYSTRIRNYAMRVLHDEHAAEDVAHDVFLRVWRYASSYDPQKVGRPEAWLFQIARNQAMNHAVQRAKVIQLDQEDGESADITAWQDGHEDGRDRLFDRVSARSEAFAQALRALPSHYRQVLFLRFHHDLSNPEIAAQLGLPVGTVKTWLRRGLIHLRATLRVEIAPSAGSAE